MKETPPVMPQPTGPKVAVAPMENRSNDITASDIVRNAFVGEIARRGWNVMPTEESDRLFRESLGITYGGQLPSTSPEEVCSALGTEGVFYGEVQEWNKTTTGIYNDVTVIASFELYAKDGGLVWKGSDTQSKVNVPRGGSHIGAEVVAHALGNLLLNPMTPYGTAVGRNIAGKLPPGALETYRPHGAGVRGEVVPKDNNALRGMEIPGGK